VDLGHGALAVEVGFGRIESEASVRDVFLFGGKGVPGRREVGQDYDYADADEYSDGAFDDVEPSQC